MFLEVRGQTNSLLEIHKGVLKMQKWEYTQLLLEYFSSKSRTIDLINKFGEEAWELVCINQDIAYFKRPLLPVNALGDSEQLDNVESVELPDGYWSR